LNKIKIDPFHYPFHWWGGQVPLKNKKQKKINGPERLVTPARPTPKSTLSAKGALFYSNFPPEKYPP